MEATEYSAMAIQSFSQANLGGVLLLALLTAMFANNPFLVGPLILRGPILFALSFILKVMRFAAACPIKTTRTRSHISDHESCA